MKKAKTSRVKVARKSAAADHIHADDGIDGCELDFTTMEATPDAALPAALGGVAGAGRSRGKRASARS